MGWTFIGWIIALVWSFTADVKTSGQDKLTDVKPPDGIIDAVKGSNNKDARISFSGEPELSNDSYVLYLAKKFNIHKNDVLGKYVLNERLYDTIDDALSAGDELNNLEIKVEKSRAEQRARDYEQAAVLYLAKKFNIHKNDVLGKYVLNERLYDTIDDALSAGDELNNLEIKVEKSRAEQRARDYEQVALKAAQADKVLKVKLFYWAKITLIFILVILLLWAAFFQASKHF